MKKAVLVSLIICLVLQLGGCKSKLLEKPEVYSQMRIARLSDQGQVTIGMESQQFEGLLSQLSGKLQRKGTCKAGHEHKYLISLLTFDEVTMALYLDEEGVICQEGKRFASHKKSANPISTSEWDAAFEEALLYTTSGNGGAMPGDPVVTAKNPPKRVAGTENAESKTFFISAKGWDYYGGVMPLEGTRMLVLWRENSEGTAQRLLSMPQAEDGTMPHEVQYMEGSFEKSQEQFLFFTVKSGASGHNALWQFNVNNEKLGRYLDYPCSNMIFTELSMTTLKDRAWIAQDQNILAIDMSTGFLDYDASMSLRNVVNDSMFYVPESTTLVKHVELADLHDGIISVSVITTDKETGVETARETYNLNVVTKRMLRE